jgi:tetratricopeptide (TPR) repeat protein
MVHRRNGRITRPASLSLLATALLCAALTQPAHAQSDRQASEFFRAGEAAYGRADFPAAARAFEEAHRRAPHAATLYNGGLAWELAGEAARAADDYDAALKLGSLDPRQAADANMRLGALEKRLGRLAIIAPTGNVVSVAHVERAEIPVQVHVLPGHYEVTLFRPNGRTDSVPVVGSAGARTEIAFDADLAPQPVAVPMDLQAPTPTESDHRRTWGWIAAGSGGALAGAAIYLGVQALSARDSYNESGHTDRSAYDRAGTLRTWTNVLWIGAGIAAAASATLFLSAPRRPTGPHAASVRWAKATVALGSIALALGF